MEFLLLGAIPIRYALAHVANACMVLTFAYKHVPGNDLYGQPAQSLRVVRLRLTNEAKK
jgi:hypothetical protein